MKTKAVGSSLAVLFLVNVLNIYDRQALSAVVEPLRHEFHLTDTELGLMPTLFTVLYALAGLPLGRAADTWSRRRLLACGIAVWAALTAMAGLAVNYATLLATRLGVGIGEAVCAPTGTSWIGDIVPSARRARAMAIFMMAVPVGVMLGMAITGPVAQEHGWRAAMTVAAIPALALIPAVLWLPEPVRGGGGTARVAGSFEFLRMPAFWWIAASGAIANAALYSFSYFLPAFLTRVHGVSVAQAGVWSGVGSGIAGIAGASAVAAFGDRREKGRLGLAALAALAAAPLMLISLRVELEIALLCAMLGYGLLQTYYGLVYAALHDVVAPELRGTAMSAYLLVTYLCGASFGPLLTGRLSDYFARSSGVVGEGAKAAGLHQAMYVIPVMCVGLAIVLWTGQKACPTGSPTGS